MGGVISSVTDGRAPVRAFGEMVALLWAEGNYAGAIRLEELWNELQKSHSFSLFCAYPMHSFGGEVYEAEFTEICKQHARVIPAESYTLLSGPDERLRAITLLQQKANSLKVEKAQRERVEEALLHLAAIVESSDDAIIGKNLEGIVTSWNAAAERIYGYSAEEIVGQPITLLFALDRQDEFKQIMARIRRGERDDASELAVHDVPPHPRHGGQPGDKGPIPRWREPHNGVPAVSRGGNDGARGVPGTGSVLRGVRALRALRFGEGGRRTHRRGIRGQGSRGCARCTRVRRSQEAGPNSVRSQYLRRTNWRTRFGVGRASTVSMVSAAVMV